jgi:hypothetical protein
VVTHKYINPGSIGEWIRRANKNIPNCSIIWKAVIKSFHVIGDGLAWKIGRGDKLRIGSDPWLGSGNAHSLSQELQYHLHTQGLYKLNQIVDPGSTNIWHQGWHSIETLGPEGDLKYQWDNYLFSLQRDHIRLLDMDDELVWQKPPHGVYTPKLGYTTFSLDHLQDEPRWWWKGLWKLKAPLKSKLFMWTALLNKVPTWDKMRKRQIEGPGWCSLCKGDSETLNHILITYPFTKKVWRDVALLLRKRCEWNGQTLDSTWKSWLLEVSHKTLKALPLLINWGVSLARNRAIFQEKATVTDLVAAQSLSILEHFPQEKNAPSI